MRLHRGKALKNNREADLQSSRQHTVTSADNKEIYPCFVLLSFGKKESENCPNVSSFAYQGAVQLYRAAVLRVLLRFTRHLGGFSLKIVLPQSVYFNK